MGFKSKSQMKSQKMGANIWTIVKLRKQVKRRKLPPDAIAFESRGDLTFAETLRKVKGALTINGPGDNITRIRRTMTKEDIWKEQMREFQIPSAMKNLREALV